MAIEPTEDDRAFAEQITDLDKARQVIALLWCELRNLVEEVEFLPGEYRVILGDEHLYPSVLRLVA